MSDLSHHEPTPRAHRGLVQVTRWPAIALCAMLAGCGPSVSVSTNNLILNGTGQANLRDYWAETTAISLPPRPGRPQSLIFVGAMQWNDLSKCGTTGLTAEFLGCGWGTYLSGGHGPFVVNVHSASDFPALPDDCLLPHGDPKAATDGTNIFYAQMCGSQFNAGGVEGDGLVVAISTNEGDSFGTLCTVCVGQACSAPLDHFVVDAPDLYYDPVEGALYMAWWDVDVNGGRVIFTRNLTPTACNGWETPKPILVPNGVSQRGPAIMTWPILGGVRLLIAYHTKPVNDKIEIHVAYTDDNGATPWADVLLEKVDVVPGQEVASEQIFQPPRPDIVRRQDFSQALVVAYPTFDTTTGTNDIATQISGDGGQSWIKEALPLPPKPKHDRFFPTLAATEPVTRRVVMAYYDTREDADPVGRRLGVWASVLDSATNKWGNPFPVASGANVPFKPCIINPQFYGHYLGIAAVTDSDPTLPSISYWPHWADSRSLEDNQPKTEVWSARVVP